jgi:hypothetical protein
MKTCGEVSNLVQIGQNMGHFVNTHCCVRHNSPQHFCAILNKFMQLKVTSSSATHIESIVALPLLQGYANARQC